MLAETSAYVKSNDGQTKWVYFLIEDDDLLVKYTTIWNKASVDIKKQFDSKLVYNFENKNKSYVDEVTNIYDKEISKADSNHTCLTVIGLDCAPKKMKTIISKYFQKGVNTLKMGIRHILDHLESSSVDSNEAWMFLNKYLY